MGGSPSPSRHTPHVRPSRLWRHLPAPADSGAAGVRDTASPPPPARVPVSSRRPHSQITIGIAASGGGYANPSRLCGVRRIFRTGKSPASAGCGCRPRGDSQILRVRDDDMHEHYSCCIRNYLRPTFTSPCRAGLSTQQEEINGGIIRS